MKTAFRPLLAAALAVLPLAAAVAQSQTATPSSGEPGSAIENKANPVTKERTEQTIQRIRTEDAGSRIDELRVGGETQSITVQPKTGNAPSYEVKPAESSRGNAPAAAGGDTNGSRVWNVLKF